MIKFAQATDNDLEKLLGLIETGFSVQSSSANPRESMRDLKGNEHRVLFSYLYSLNPGSLNRVYLALDGGQLIAAVGFFPHHLYFERIRIPIWAVSPVVTHPDYRGRGIAARCLTGALESLRRQGVPAVFLWGLPGYYPRFGFVPLLPRFKTKLTKEQLSLSLGKWRVISGGAFRRPVAGDVTLISDLYNQGNHRYWLQPERSLVWWRERFAEMDIAAADLKEVPFPRKENFLVWENYPGKVSGYINYEIIPNSPKLIITEGTTEDPQSALAMLETFIQENLKPGWTLYLRGTPEHFLNMALYRLGGTHLNPAPLAGMIKIIDWDGFFKYLRPLFSQRLQNHDKSFDLPDLKINNTRYRLHWEPNTGMECEPVKSCRKGNPSFDEAGLTRLLFGFYDAIDGFNLRHSRLKILFPMKYPFIWDANYLY